MHAHLPHWITSSPIKKLFRAIPNSMETLRFVGGCVRDHLLGIESQDIDLATSYPPLDIMNFLKKSNLKFVPTGLDHGTVMAIIEEKGYEITTLRHDIETDGRHANVVFTNSWQEDAARRDFTFNALYMDINGTITDFWDGTKDLAAGHVNFIGDPSKRIKEDYLRILRFFRFYARFSDKNPDNITLNAIHNNATGLKNISGERIKTELLKLLECQSPLPAISLMEKTHIFHYVLERNEPLNMDILKRLLKTGIKTSSLTKLLALLGSEENNIENAAKRLKFSKKQRTWISCVNALSLKFEAEPLDIHLHFQGTEKVLAAYAIMLSRKDIQVKKTLLNHIKNWEHKSFPMTGQDLIEKGFKPGPHLGAELKRQERNWILEGRLKS